MHLLQKVDDMTLREQATRKPPFGPGFPVTLVAQAAWMEVYGSDITDAGGDYCVFMLLDIEGNLIEARRIKGY